MTEDQRPDIQLGTGSPRSALDQQSADTQSTGEGRLSRIRVDGQQTTLGAHSDPALPDGVDPNRSGSGGSGGPANPSVPPEEEGSSNRSMDDLLGGTEPPAINEP